MKKHIICYTVLWYPRKTESKRARQKTRLCNALWWQGYMFRSPQCKMQINQIRTVCWGLYSGQCWHFSVITLLNFKSRIRYTVKNAYETVIVRFGSYPIFQIIKIAILRLIGGSWSALQFNINSVEIINGPQAIHRSEGYAQTAVSLIVHQLWGDDLLIKFALLFWKQAFCLSTEKKYYRLSYSFM